MNIIVNSDRTVEKEYTEKDGSQNENRVTELNFTLPEAYSGEGFVPKIAFITEDGNFSDYIENGTYVLKNNITKYREVVCFVWLTNSVNNIDFRSQTFKLDFYYNEDPSNYIPSEQEKSQIELLMEELEEKIQEVTELEENVYTKDETYSKEEVDEIIPTDISDLNNDSGFIDKDVNNLTNYYKKSETYTKQEIDEKISSVYKYKGTVASYNNLPSTGLTIGDVYNVEDTGDNYAWTGTDWDKLGGDIDLSGYYTKNETDTLLGAKQNTINAQNKLNSDLVDDTNHTNKFVTASEKNTWNAKYNKPSGGIPKTDLESSVQTSLGKADTALQEEDLQDLETQVETIEEDLYGEIDIEVENDSVTLTGTKEGRDLSIKKIYGYHNQVTREGYNKFIKTNTTIVNNNGITSSSFTEQNLNLVVYGTWSSQERKLSGLEPNETYTIIADIEKSNASLTSGFYNGSTYIATGFVQSGVSSGKAYIELTSDSEGNVDFYFYTNWSATGYNGTVTYKNIMVYKGNYDSTKPYEAYGASPTIDFPSPVKVVDGEYEILARDVNLANIEDFNVRDGAGTTYGKVIENIKSDTNYTLYFIKSRINGVTISNTTLYPQRRIKFFNGDTELSEERDNTTSTFSDGSREFIRQITTPANCNKIIAYFDNENGDTNINTRVSEVMLVKGTYTLETIPEYCKYQNQTQLIDTSPNPLYSENDCYKYLTLEQATALGLNTGAGWYCYNEYYNQNFTSGVSSVTINDMKSNGQFYSTVGGTVSETTITFSGTTTGNGNIVYELATPTNTKITNANLINSLNAIQELKQYEDTTIITIGDIYKFDLAYDGDRIEVLLDDVANLKSGKEDKTNKTSTIDENSTNTQYTGAKAVYDYVESVKTEIETEQTEQDEHIEVLEKVVSNLPKTEEKTGSNITLENTIEGYFYHDDNEQGMKLIGQMGQDGTPTPDNEIPVKCVTGNQDVVVSGKNEFDIGTSLDDYFQTGANGTRIGNMTVNVATATIENNKLTIDSYNTSGYNWISKWVNLKKDTDYIISGTNDSGLKIVGFTSNELQATGTQIIDKLASDTTKSFNSGNYEYYCLSFYPRSVGKYFENIQIEQGNQATTYEPYITPTSYQLSLGDRKVFEGDYFWRDNNGKFYHHHKMGRKIIDGTNVAINDRWSTNTTNYYGFIIPFSNNQNTTDNDQTIGIYCNKLKEKTSNQTYQNNVGINALTSGNRIAIYTDETKSMSIVNANAWLSNNNLEVVYPLETETDTEITDITLISQLEALYNAHSNNGTTIIEIECEEGNMPIIINAKALKSLKAMQSETDTLLNAKVDKSSFVYDSNTETLSITIS